MSDPIDHLKLVRRDPDETARLLAIIRDPVPGIMEVHHHPGNLCCHHEPWHVTYLRLVAEANPPHDCATLDIDLRDRL